MRPLVSILFPCYNAEKFLYTALESILNQHYSNLQVICINDGSSDRTLEILSDFTSADTRIEIVTMSQNMGLIHCLNTGIRHVKGEFFARMDADDYCPPDRISTQVEFLELHPEVELISGGYEYFTEEGKVLEYVPPVATSSNALQFISLFSTPLTHASVLARSSVLTEGYYYDKNFPHSEDYELFSRLALKGLVLANINKSLYKVRLNSQSVSVLHNATQIESHLRITDRNIKESFGLNENFNVLQLKVLSNRIDAPVTFEVVSSMLQKLKYLFAIQMQTSQLSRAERKEIRNYLHLHMVNIIIQSNKIGFKYLGAKNIKFFLRSLMLLRPVYCRHILNKTLIFFKFRLL